VKLTLLLVAAALSVAASAVAYVPLFPVSSVTIRTGEQISVPVHAAWSGLDTSFKTYHWEFYSNDEDVAIVKGQLQDPNPDGVISIIGVGPGDTYVKVGRDGDWPWVRIHVDCAPEPGVIAASPVVVALQGQAVTLQAISAIPANTVFQWFAGRLADFSHPITDADAGPELSLIAQTPGPNYIWVVARTPCLSSIAEFRIDVAPIRRRSAGR
jgi:hypothetical protein